MYCPLSHLRKAHSPYTLPCRHVLTSVDEVVTLSNVHARYYSTAESGSVPRSDSLGTVPVARDNAYTSIMARIAPFASAAERIPDMGRKLNALIDDLDKTRQELNRDIPATLAIAGRLSQHPSSKVVLGGKSKQKKVYTCSVCGQPGHNRATCPKALTD